MCTQLGFNNNKNTQIRKMSVSTRCGPQLCSACAVQVVLPQSSVSMMAIHSLVTLLIQGTKDDTFV